MGIDFNLVPPNTKTFPSDQVRLPAPNPHQVASLANVGSNYLVAGQEAHRFGTAHPSIVPYQSFATSTTPITIAVGNDKQFKALCYTVLLQPQLSDDPRFLTNNERVKNRVELVGILDKLFAAKPRDEWVKLFEGKG